MTKIKFFFPIVLYFFFISIPPHANANIDESDEFWRYRSALSLNRTLKAYQPNPEKIISHVNLHVDKMMKEIGIESINGTRRELAKKGRKGPCRSTNPIDACWRCRPYSGVNRYNLANCGLGFGKKATGGKNGPFYVITDPSDRNLIDPKPGTLRHAVTRKGPLWITFKRDMIITLQQELLVTSHKTIDARGAAVYIAYGAGITLQFVRNIIIHGLKIHDIKPGGGGLIRDSHNHFGIRTKSDGDGITLFGSQNVWIDHLSMTRCADGIIDVLQGSTAVTISNCHFTDHDHTMLFGAHDDYLPDKKMQITIVFNHFGKRLVQRMPRCRLGFFHIVNNDYTHWQMYAIGGTAAPTIISQGNRYIANFPLARQVTNRNYGSEAEWRKWTWVSDKDLFLRGAYFVTSGQQDWYNKHPEMNDKVRPRWAALVADMTAFTGALNCKPNRVC